MKYLEQTQIEEYKSIMEKIDLNTFGKPKRKPKPKLDLDLPWQDPKKYSYKELQTIENCQRCGVPLPKISKWINVDRRTCEKCFNV